MRPDDMTPKRASALDRYFVDMDPTQRFWVIYDMEWWAACRLPDPKTGELRRLEWGTLNRDGAQRWLDRCVRAWGTMPQRGEPHPADIGPTLPQ